MNYELGHSGIEHSKLYDWSTPVYRRGETIPIYLSSYNQPNILHKSVKVLIKLDNSYINKNEIVYSNEKPDKACWWIQVTEDNTSSTTLKILIPCHAIPGNYKFGVYSHKTEITSIKVLIFYNPWCPDDETYIHDDDERQEYVLNQDTLIYYGNSSYVLGMNWHLGQFNKHTIKVLLMFLQMIKKEKKEKPYLLCRELCALVNSNDDDGILVGNWSGDYSHGTSPTAWVSSVPIMKKYIESKKPVKYGQCWVFAALLCTLCRCIGIPTRIITNFDSLHDGDGTLDREIYLDENNNEIDYLSRDSIWNFHVWNECYLARNDVDRKYHGWQIVDATPQERSKDRRYVCGPCPLEAVNAGDIKVEYDAPFIFAEVNGDIVYKKKINGKFTTVQILTDSIGSAISTKKVGSNHREDVTLNYKYRDLSSMDFMVRKKVEIEKLGSTKKLKKLSVKLSEDKKQIIMGEDLCYSVKVVGTSEISGGTAIIRCSVINYRGEKLDKVFQKEYLLNSEKVTLTECIPSDAVLKGVTGDIPVVLIEAFITYSSNIFQYESAKFNLITPTFDLIVSDPLTYDLDQEIKVSAYNPFPETVRNVKVKLYSACFKLDYKRNIVKIEPKETRYLSFTIKPSKRGYHNITAIITSANWPVFKEITTVSIV